MKNKIIAFISALMLILCSADNIFALDAYGTDAEKNTEAFCEQYGWNKNCLNAYKWTDGINTYTRTSKYEKQFFFDTLTLTQRLVIDLNFDILKDYEYLGGSIVYSGYTGNASAIVNCALSQVGNNGSKYQRFCGCSAWCAAFISWIANENGLCEAGIIPKTAGCQSMYQYFINKGYAHWYIQDCVQYGGSYTPQPGDIILCGCGGKGVSGSHHVLMIVKCYSDYVVTVEGNWGGKVAMREVGYSNHVLTKQYLKSHENDKWKTGYATVFRIPYP